MTLGFGFIALVSQAVLLRELGVLFRGNEVAIGIMLFSWLCGGALGSLAYRFLPLSLAVNARLPERLLFAISAAMTFLVFAVRYLFGFFQFEAIPNLLVLALLSFLLSLPVSFLIGLTFPALVAARSEAGAAGRVDRGEAAGALLGGLVLTFPLSEADSVVRTFLLVLVSASFLVNRGRMLPRGRLAASLLVPALFVPAVLHLSDTAATLSRKAQFRNSEFVSSRVSRYGDVAVVRIGGLRTTYYNGSIVWHDEADALEEVARAPSLVARIPKRILVLGFAPPPLLAALAEYRPDRITVVLRDPALAPAAAAGVEVVIADPFRWARAAEDTYDLVILRRGLPLNISDSSLYSRTLYSRLKALLNEGGVLSIFLPYEENRPDPHTLGILKSVTRTLESCFTSVAFIPGESFILFASKSGISAGVADAGKRLRMSGGEGRFVNEGYVSHYLAPDRLERFGVMLHSGPAAPVNDLFSMRIYRESLKRRLATDLGEAGVVLALLLAGLAYMAGRNRHRLQELLDVDHRSVFMFGAGFAGMAGELELLNFYQGVNGHVFHAYGLLVAAFMAGACGGTSATLNSALRPRATGAAATVALLLWVWAIGMLYFFEPGWLCSDRAMTACVVALNFTGGLAIGAVFGSESRIAESSGETGGSVASRIYSFDMFGAGTASLVMPLFLIPALGATMAADVAFVVLAAAAALTWRARYAA